MMEESTIAVVEIMVKPRLLSMAFMPSSYLRRCDRPGLGEKQENRKGRTGKIEKTWIFQVSDIHQNRGQSTVVMDAQKTPTRPADSSALFPSFLDIPDRSQPFRQNS
jgi:hypothetical protein